MNSELGHTRSKTVLYLEYLIVFILFWVYHEFSKFFIYHSHIRVQISPEAAPLFGVVVNVAPFKLRWLLSPFIAYFELLFFSLLIYKNKLSRLGSFLFALFFVELVVNIGIEFTDIWKFPIISLHGASQYINDVNKFNNLGDILKNYVSKMYVLTTHSGTHPPGPVILMWILTKLFGFNYLIKIVFILLIEPFTAFYIYFLGKELYSERVSQYGVLLYIISPSIVMYGFASMDAVYAVFLVGTLYYFIKSMVTVDESKWRYIAGIFFVVSSMLTFASSFLIMYFFFFTILTYFLNREYYVRSLKTFITIILMFISVLLFLKFFFHFDYVACLLEAMKIDAYGSLHHSGCGTGFESPERYFFISFSNLLAFFIGMGIPGTTLWFRELWSIAFGKRDVRKFEITDVFIISFIVTLLLNAFGGLYTLETERIWMFLSPFIILPAAKNFTSHLEEIKFKAEPFLTITLAFIQTLLLEILLATLW